MNRSPLLRSILAAAVAKGYGERFSFVIRNDRVLVSPWEDVPIEVMHAVLAVADEDWVADTPGARIGQRVAEALGRGLDIREAELSLVLTKGDMSLDQIIEQALSMAPVSQFRRMIGLVKVQEMQL